ncbi:MAG: hypothetical protein AAF328_08215 [Planctomycetota bacterium]
MKFAPSAVVVAVSSASLLATLTGCDPSAKNRGEAARLLNQGVAAMLEADTAKASDNQRLSEVRLGMLSAAVAPLEEAASKGAPAQQAQANLLLARIEAQAAEALARDAASGSADTRLALVGLLARLDAIEALGSTALTAQRDPAEAIAQMDEAIASGEAKKTELATQVARLQATVADLESQITKQQEAARGAFAEKTNLESAAFVLDGDDKYETLSQATAAQRRADIADVQAQELTIEREQAVAELDLVDRELTLAQESLDRFLDTRDAFAQAGQDAERVVRELRAQQAELTDGLAADLEQRVNTFYETVTGPITQAAQRAQTAVDRTVRAGSGLRGAEQRQQQLETLDKMHLLTQTLADAASYHAGLDASLEAMVGRSVFERAPELRQKIDTISNELSGVAQAFRDQAGEALTATQQQLESLGDDAETAATVRDAVARLASQINAG